MLRRAVLSLIFAAAAPAFAKSLYWRAIDIHATLDAHARLHVVEKQVMVFDGSWNGGERDFNVRPGQTLALRSISRIADDGTPVAMTPGLDHVDGYDWYRDGVLRWRSRQPDDPWFHDETRTYVLDYEWRNIVARDGDTYVLDHDFGLPHREGEIERYTLRVDFDPIWNRAPIVITRDHVAPGAEEIVHTELHATRPVAETREMLPAWVPLAAIALFVAGAAFQVMRFVAGEKARGRFDPVEPRFDEALLKLAPEVAGAIWDDDVGAAEVSAVLARMSQEGKLATHVEGKTLHMQLRVARRELHGYERELVDKLFFDGGDRTSTDAVRSYYRSSGFNPAKIIRPDILQQLAAIPELAGTERRTNRALNALLMVSAGAMLIAIAWLRPHERAIAIGSMLVGAFCLLFACAFAWDAGKRVTGFAYLAWAPGIPFAIGMIPYVVALAKARAWNYEPVLLFAMTLWQLAMFNVVVDLLKIRDLPERIRFRKRLAGVRAFFASELQREHPALRDDWFPYVLAFGLGKNADRWFRAGGAGSSTSWVIAASVMSAGVSRPSSSSGSGASSGGGGGGGW